MCCGERKEFATKVAVRNWKPTQGHQNYDKYFLQEKQNKRFNANTTQLLKWFYDSLPCYMGPNTKF